MASTIWRAGIPVVHPRSEPHHGHHPRPGTAPLAFSGITLAKRRAVLDRKFPDRREPEPTHLLAGNALRPSLDSLVSFGSLDRDIASRRELAALQGVYRKIGAYMGEGADKQTFLTAIDTAPVLHCAGHSARDAANPLESSIFLDGIASGPNNVTAIEIASRRLRRNGVVILSSCDSSVGNSRDGVGMRGLTSAFLIAGAGSVVGSLWPVESLSTTELMIRFHYAFGSTQKPVAHALRDAQLSFLRAFPQKSHPYYWSAFVVTGNLSALR